MARSRPPHHQYAKLALSTPGASSVEAGAPEGRASDATPVAGGLRDAGAANASPSPGSHAPPPHHARPPCGRLTSLWRSYTALSPNVKVIFAFTLLFFLLRAVWMAQQLSEYVILMTEGSNKAIGFIAAAMGIAELAAAGVAGWASDRFRRDRVLRFAIGIGVVGSVLAVVGFAQDQLTMVTASLAVWGFFRGVGNPAIMSIFADSVPTGDRAGPYNARAALQQIASAIGPMLSAVWFLAAGGTGWDLGTLRVLLLAGGGLMLVPVLILMRVSDDKSLGAVSEAVGVSPVGVSPQARPSHASGGTLGDGSTPEFDGAKAATGAAAALPGEGGDTVHDEREGRPLIEVSVQHSSGTAMDIPSDAKPGSESADGGGRGAPYQWRCCGVRLTSASVQWIIPVSDMAFSIGAGMTVQFFSLFFIHDFGMGPVSLNVLFAVMRLVAAACMGVSTWAAKRWGRAVVGACFKWTGTALLAAMALPLPVWIIAPFFVLRTALLNASIPLDKSMLMDYVPKKNRGKFSAIESVASFTWTGSAAAGGFLVDAFGFRFCFLVTATMYVVPCVLSLLLVRVVPAKTPKANAGPSTGAGESDSERGTGRDVGSGLPSGGGVGVSTAGPACVPSPVPVAVRVGSASELEPELELPPRKPAAGTGSA